MANKYRLTTQSAIAEFAGVTTTTVADWIRKGMPGRRSDYNASDIFRWYRSTIVPNATPASGDSKEGLEKEKLRIGNDRLRLRLARDRAELINRAAAVAEVEQMLSAIAARLESVPEEMGSSQPPNTRAEVVADWKNKMDMLRRELASFQIEEGKTARPQKSKLTPKKRPEKHSSRVDKFSRRKNGLTRSTGAGITS